MFVMFDVVFCEGVVEGVKCDFVVLLFGVCVVKLFGLCDDVDVVFYVSGVLIGGDVVVWFVDMFYDMLYVFVDLVLGVLYVLVIEV